MKRIAILLLAFAVFAIAITTATSGVSENNAAVQIDSDDPARQSPQSNIDRAGTIDGAKNPEKIPNHVAYSLLFRLIGGRQTVEEKERARSYVRQMGLGGADIDAFIAASEEFHRQINVLDNQAAAIKDRHFFRDGVDHYHPNGSTATVEERAQLRQMQTQKEIIVTRIAASLKQRLSADGSAKVRQHVNERMKRKIKLSAGSPPN